jgi:hypothetical protein
MNRLTSPALWRAACVALCPMLMLGTVNAGTVSGPSAPPAALALHQQQQAACAKKASASDRAGCTRRADAQLAEALRAQTEARENAVALTANALQRCQAHSPPERETCERMARGEGSATGSVEGGGTIKELTTRTVGPVPEAPASAASR